MIISSMFSTVANGFKPHKAEAAQRIRLNTLSLLTILLLSYLLPLPSLPTALKTMISSRHHQRWSAEWVWDWICLIETALATLLAYNILEASYAIKYPRAPLPPLVSPAKPKAAIGSTPQRPFNVLSPKARSSPHAQKPFAFSPKVSTRSVNSSPAFNKSMYARSPDDTPSRVLSYGPIPSSSSTISQASSISDYLQTPSPIISAYRGRHSGDVGHALDGSYLSRILPEVDDDED